MAQPAGFKTNLPNFAKEIKQLAEHIRINASFKALDVPIYNSLAQLRDGLRTYIKNQVNKAPGSSTTTNTSSSTQIQPPLTQSKTREVLLNHFTGINTSEFNSVKDKVEYYTSQTGPKLVHARPSKGQGSAARVTLRMPISAGETVETQYYKAKAFFENSIIAYPGDGNMDQQFIMNIGNVGDSLKIKCSKYKGFDNYEEYGGFSPQRRFEAYQSGGFAEWTLTQEFVRKTQTNGINVSKIVDDILEGKYDAALDYAASLKGLDIQTQKTLMQKIENLEQGTNLAPETNTYNNITKLINNLNILKKIKKHSVSYSVISNYGDDLPVDFEQELRTQIAQWKMVNEESWVKALLDKIVEEIHKFYQGRQE